MTSKSAAMTDDDDDDVCVFMCLCQCKWERRELCRTLAKTEKQNFYCLHDFKECLEETGFAISFLNSRKKKTMDKQQKCFSLNYSTGVCSGTNNCYFV